MCRRYLIALLLIVSSVPLPGMAYETDLHYGLTYWLSRQAGFTLEQSREIARGDERTDSGPRDAKHLIIWGVCFQHNSRAAQMVRNLHFRSANPALVMPRQRPVSYLDAFAREATEKTIGDHSVAPLYSLLAFGEALHGWQDSYSHQGVSSTLAPCPSELTWAHPEERGGPFSHRADLTWQFPADCLAAGQTTYGALQRYRQAHALSNSGPAWNTMVPEVEQFCVARTKAAKGEWLTRHDVWQSRAVAANTDLEDGSPDYSSYQRWLHRERDLDLSAAPMMGNGSFVRVGDSAPLPPSVENGPQVEALIALARSIEPKGVSRDLQMQVNQFLEDWLTVDPEQLRDRLNHYFPDPQFGNFAANQLLLLRVADRGKAGTMRDAQEPFSAEPQPVIGATAADWRGLLVPVLNPEKQALAGYPEDNSPYVVVLAILKSAPRDVLMFSLQSDTSELKLVGLQVFTFH